MDIDISEEDKAELVKQIKSRKRASSKTSIAKASPLKHAPQQQPRSSRTVFVKRWNPKQGLREGSEAEKLKEIEKHIESLLTLPKSSKYAQHKLKTLQKAQELFQQG
jgi:hypothetical protein